MKNLLLIFSIFLCLSASAQNTNELWHYDVGSGKWFLVVPETDKSTDKEEAHMKGNNKNQQKRVNGKNQKKSISFETRDSLDLKFSSSSICNKAMNIIIPHSATEIITNYKPWNVYGIVRTNLLGDAILVPNIGGEITVGKNWSLGADFYLQWITNRDKDKFYQTYILDVDARYWWGKQHAKRRLSGWHFGPYGQAITWDMENGHKGTQSRVFFWTFAVGGELGYNLPLGKKQRWGLDFNIGIGYLHTKYNVYYPGHNRKYYFDHRQCKNFFGPTRLGISLNYFIK